jgi:DNA-binding XRE family transcriptional regulator
LWGGPTNNRGYGLFTVKPGRQRVRAHRLAWLISRGDIPKGLDVCHRCDNTLCVNPAHLFVATHRENLHDAIRKGRKRAWGLQKLNAGQVETIRARCAAGEFQRAVAADFGVARNTVSQIVNGKTWAHLPVAHPARQRAHREPAA